MKLLWASQLKECWFILKEKIGECQYVLQPETTHSTRWGVPKAVSYISEGLKLNGDTIYKQL
jgi:hypothetical protein